MDEKGAKDEEGVHDDRSLNQNSPREGEEKIERHTSPRNSREASASLVEGNLEQGDPP